MIWSMWNYRKSSVKVTKWISACQEPEDQTAMNQRRMFPGDGNIPYSDCGGGYTAINPCQNSYFVPLNVVNLFYINIPQYSLQREKKYFHARANTWKPIIQWSPDHGVWRMCHFEPLPDAAEPVPGGDAECSDAMDGFLVVKPSILVPLLPLTPCRKVRTQGKRLNISSIILQNNW